jgi:hypothetical protein
MRHALDETLRALPGVTRRLRQQLALVPLRVDHYLVDPRTPPPPAYWIEEVHQPDAE